MVAQHQVHGHLRVPLPPGAQGILRQRRGAGIGRAQRGEIGPAELRVIEQADEDGRACRKAGDPRAFHPAPLRLYIAAALPYK